MEHIENTKLNIDKKLSRGPDEILVNKQFIYLFIYLFLCWNMLLTDTSVARRSKRRKKAAMSKPRMWKKKL